MLATPVRHARLAALALCLVAAPALAQPSRESLRDEITRRNREMEAAFRRGDMRGVARFYADSARLMGPRGELVQGRAAIDAYWGRIQGRSWTLAVLDVGGARDDAWQLGESVLVTAGTSGDITSRSRFVAIWKRGRDGQLYMTLDFYHF